MFHINLLELRRYILSDRWRTSRAFLCWLILPGTCRGLATQLHPATCPIDPSNTAPSTAATTNAANHQDNGKRPYIFAVHVKPIRSNPIPALSRRLQPHFHHPTFHNYHRRRSVRNCLPSLAIPFRPSAFRDFESTPQVNRNRCLPDIE